MEYSDLEIQNFSVLGENTTISGDIKFYGDVRIKSHIEGTVAMEDQGQIVLEINGKIHGQVKCEDIEVYGQIDGDIQARGKVVIYPGAIVTGKIKAENLAIYPGSLVNIEGQTL